MSALSAEIGALAGRRLAGFVRTLRDNGFAVGLAESADAAAILASPAASRRSSLHAAFKALFCATHSDWQRFDDIFAAYWTGRGVRYRHVASVSTREGAAPALSRRSRSAEAGETGMPQRVECGSEEDC